MWRAAAPNSEKIVLCGDERRVGTFSSVLGLGSLRQQRFRRVANDHRLRVQNLIADIYAAVAAGGTVCFGRTLLHNMNSGSGNAVNSFVPVRSLTWKVLTWTEAERGFVFFEAAFTLAAANADMEVPLLATGTGGGDTIAFTPVLPVLPAAAPTEGLRRLGSTEADLFCKAPVVACVFAADLAVTLGGCGGLAVTGAPCPTLAAALRGAEETSACRARARVCMTMDHFQSRSTSLNVSRPVGVVSCARDAHSAFTALMVSGSVAHSKYDDHSNHRTAMLVNTERCMVAHQHQRCQ